MADSLEEILRRISQDNQSARLRFASLSARTETAVANGNWDAIKQIVDEAASDGSDTTDTRDDAPEDQTGSARTMED